MLRVVAAMKKQYLCIIDTMELGSPLQFVWAKINDDDGTPRPHVGGRTPNTGYSDHLPIQAVIKTTR